MINSNFDFFVNTLLLWDTQNPRYMPWKNTQNPYHIWLSEIILQQTRVEQGTPYYEKFLQAYPTINDLAKAPLANILLLWEGLGYYARARNMHTAAKMVAYNLNGVFPTTYKSIKALKGVGDYTAAAIASFAYNLPHAVIDGNVYRLLSRFFGINTPIDSIKAKQQFAELANNLLPTNNASIYNQAIMNFGAMQCKPAKPNCFTCPLQSNCVANNQLIVDKLPVKEKKIKRTNRFFNYLFIKNNNAPLTTYIQQRTQNDIWLGLYQLPLIETDNSLVHETLIQNPDFISMFGQVPTSNIKILQTLKQQLTHQTIYATFINIETNCWLPNAEKYFLQPVPLKKISDYAYPKIINNFWENLQNASTNNNLLFA